MSRTHAIGAFFKQRFKGLIFNTLRLCEIFAQQFLM